MVSANVKDVGELHAVGYADKNPGAILYPLMGKMSPTKPRQAGVPGRQSWEVV